MKNKKIEKRDTKIKKLMISKGVNRKILIERINKLFPNSPVSPDAISRIMNGQRKNYSTITLLRICAGLNCSPNEILDFEHLIKTSKRKLN
tara:strand:+ start:217 stop:489 length:273 start_codon:yes stop_codon:yes gene_type:complete